MISWFWDSPTKIHNDQWSKAWSALTIWLERPEVRHKMMAVEWLWLEGSGTPGISFSSKSNDLSSSINFAPTTLANHWQFRHLNDVEMVLVYWIANGTIIMCPSSKKKDPVQETSGPGTKQFLRFVAHLPMAEVFNKMRWISCMGCSVRVAITLSI